MAGLQITGRHALLFDDDASATFVDSSAPLVPWAADSSLLIDRYDARHLLDRVPLRPKPGYVHKSDEDVAEEMMLDRERYLDLQAEDLPSNDTQMGIQDQGAYTSVPFFYENIREDKKDESDYKMEISSSPYRPPFALPENLLNHIPPSEKVHQIISRTAKFVTEHGGQSEIVLRVKQGNNPTFGFLMPGHHLHPYFQYLIQNPNLLKSDPSNPNPNGGALSLLGSVYGSGEDDDVITPPSNPSRNPNPKNGDLESEEKNPKALLTKNPSIVKVKDPVKLVKEEVKVKEPVELVKEPVKMIEPDSVMENAMEKIAEFVLRNGRELEKVLIEQDKGINRFLFLVPTNAYHAYYLKVLEEVKEGKRSEQSTKNQETKSCIKKRSRESTPSDEPRKHDKFKMVLSKPSKTKTDTNPTNQNATPVLTTQEVSAIVQAATRGKSPSFWSQAKTDPDLTSQNQTRPVKDNDDDAWISKAIKKTAELVSSDVSLSLSKESNKEKVKAERLKRAKMLSDMIKSSGGGPQLSELLNKVTKVDDGNENRGEMSKREKECEVMRHRDGSKHELKKYRKRNDSSDGEERESNERKKREKDDERRRHRKKHHSSPDEEGEIRERKRGKHSDDRKRRHKERDYNDYSDEERERRERNRRHHKERDYDDYKSSERRTKDERVGSTITREQSSDVPDELRAKIRAMLLQTL